MKIHQVQKARKSPGSCCVCHRPIEIGAAYKWVQEYRGVKRSAHADCKFRSSHLATGRLSEVYAAQESAQDELADVERGDADALLACLETFRDEVQRLADEYQEAADSIGEHFEGSEQHQELEDHASELEDWVSNIEDAISELENPDYDEDDEDEEDSKDKVVYLGGPNCPLHPGRPKYDPCRCVPIPANAEQLARIAAMPKPEPKPEPEPNADPRVRWFDERYDQAETIIGECPL